MPSTWAPHRSRGQWLPGHKYSHPTNLEACGGSSSGVFSQMVSDYHRSLGSTDGFFWLPVGVHQFPSICESTPTGTHTCPFRCLSSEVPRGRTSCSTTQGCHFSPSSLIKPRIVISHLPGSKENGRLAPNYQPSPTQCIYSAKTFLHLQTLNQGLERCLIWRYSSSKRSPQISTIHL